MSALAALRRGVVGSTGPLLNLNFRYQGNELFTIHDPDTVAFRLGGLIQEMPLPAAVGARQASPLRGNTT